METDSLTGERDLVGVIGKMPERSGAADDDIAGAEENLIREFVVRREPRLFETIIRSHLPWLRRLLFAIFNGSREDMEDAEQEILIGICHDIAHFRFQSSFKTFFYRYARNKAIDLLRKAVRRRRHETRLERVGPVGHPGESPSPEETYLRREHHEDLARRLLELDREERTILLMKDVEGFSIDEIAAATGQKPGTIKSKLHRTRLKLFEKLKKEGRS